MSNQINTIEIILRLDNGNEFFRLCCNEKTIKAYHTFMEGKPLIFEVPFEFDRLHHYINDCYEFQESLWDEDETED